MYRALTLLACTLLLTACTTTDIAPRNLADDAFSEARVDAHRARTKEIVGRSVADARAARASADETEPSPSVDELMESMRGMPAGTRELFAQQLEALTAKSNSPKEFSSPAPPTSRNENTLRGNEKSGHDSLANPYYRNDPSSYEDREAGEAAMQINEDRGASPPSIRPAQLRSQDEDLNVSDADHIGHVLQGRSAEKSVPTRSRRGPVRATVMDDSNGLGSGGHDLGMPDSINDVYRYSGHDAPQQVHRQPHTSRPPGRLPPHRDARPLGLPASPQQIESRSAYAQGYVDETTTPGKTWPERSAGHLRREPRQINADELGGALADPRPVDAPWSTHAFRAISALSKKLKSADMSPEERSRHEIKLRLLQLLAEDRESALRELENVNGPEADYWREQLFSMHLSLKDDRDPVLSHRATQALAHLKDAEKYLTAVSTLDLKNAALCRTVYGYADIETFSEPKFRANDQIILYVEVENFMASPVTSAKPKGGTARSTQSVSGYETELEASYQILGEDRGREVDETLPTDKQVCRNYRRDYYIAYRIYLPKRIAAGKYTMQLNIKDVKGDKHGQAFLDFKIVE